MLNKIKGINLLLILVDTALIAISYVLSLVILGFNYSDPSIISNIVVSIFIFQTFLNLFNMYQNMIYYEIGKDYLTISILITSYILFVHFYQCVY